MKALTFLATVALALFWASVASANSYTFATAANATESGGNAVDGSVTFTTSADTLTISINNLLVNPKNVAQDISDLFFTLGGIGGSANSGTISSSGGNLVNIDGSGTPTSAGSTGAGNGTGWVLSFSSGTGFHLNGLGAANTPAYTIVGAPDGSGIYSAANSSIAGNGPHNPFLDQLATFTLSIAGITADTIITGATLSFGTTAGDDVTLIPTVTINTNSIPPSVPDNGVTLVMLGAALVGLGLFRRTVLKLSPVV